MKQLKNIALLLVVFLILTALSPPNKKAKSKHYAFQFDTLTLHDQARNRVVPVAYYSPKCDSPQIVIISHGYGQNRDDSYLKYTYLSQHLAAQGYFVASIQHELSTDSIIPNGIPQIVRRPFWDRGADNILFTIQTLKKTHPQLDFNHITLIGHSNGGDMSALFPQKYPQVVQKIITLDNRRMALPRSKSPKVYSLRSSDLPADTGVIPTTEEQIKWGITIIQLPNTIHNDMDDGGTKKQKREITNYILQFLKEE